MHPNNSEQSGLHLPEPIEQSALPQAGQIDRLAVARPEVAAELHPQMVPLTPVAPPPMTGVSPIPIAPPVSAQPSQVPGPTGLTAADSDLIEKQWVEKAKQIVEQTKEDPYAQSSKMSEFKAEYMKKRYNKDIKLPQT